MKSLNTKALHADSSESKDQFGSHINPVYATSTFTFENTESGRKLFAGEEGGASHTYSRIANPTVQALETAIKRQECHGLGLDEKEIEAMVFGSGMAAITTAMFTIAPAGTIVAQNTLYGCTHQFLTEQAGKVGIEAVMADDSSTEAFLKTLQEVDKVDLVYLETIANPTLRMLDISRIIKSAHARGAVVMIDNTFASPYHCQPFSLGADIVVYSTTKYQNGMGTSVGGVVISRLSDELNEQMHLWRKNLGGIASPFDAWLTIQGLKTLPLRMERHSKNALQIAHFLDKHQALQNVYYPGLERKSKTFIEDILKHGYGGVVSFELPDYDTAVAFMDHLEICSRAVSLGHPDTLIQHPASMTHSVMSKEERQQFGINDGLIRIAVGLEFVDDIVEDLEQALNAVPTTLQVT